MDIFVVGSSPSDRLQRLQRHARARGCTVRHGPAWQPVADLAQVVLVDAGEADALRLLPAVREATRYRSVVLAALLADQDPEAGEHLPTARIDVLCDAAAPDDLILNEMETACVVRPVSPEDREHFLEPFLSAAGVALREWAGTETAVQAVYRKARHAPFGDIAARMDLRSGMEQSIVLSFPRATAAALAGRILSRPANEIAEDLICDCVCEIVNVLAGQAKALLAATVYHFTFSTPTVAAGADLAACAAPHTACLIGVFGSDLGEIALQLFVNRSRDAAP
jgi:chemotaxis protein CheX